MIEFVQGMLLETVLLFPSDRHRTCRGPDAEELQIGLLGPIAKIISRCSNQHEKAGFQAAT